MTDKSPASNATASPVKPDEIITSIRVVGADYEKNSILYYSNDIDTTLKEMVDSLRDRTKQSGLDVTKGKKVDFKTAEAAAKKESSTYILWIGLRTGSSSVEYIDYALLAPQTGKHLMEGRVDPKQTNLMGPGGITSIPTVRKSGSTFSGIIAGTREITERIIHSGWLD